MPGEEKNLNEKEKAENLIDTKNLTLQEVEDNTKETTVDANEGISVDKGNKNIAQPIAEDKGLEKHLTISGLLVEPPDIYLENGVHIGLKFKTKDMKPYIYRTKTVKTPDGFTKISIFDIAKIDKKIIDAAKFLSMYDPADVVVVSNNVYGRKPAAAFAKYCGFKFIEGRFDSGTFTNKNSKKYIEPKVVVVTNPAEDKQAIKEAAKEHIVVVAFGNSNTRLKNIDFVIPGNNTGKYSIAMLYWLLTKEISKIKGFEFNVPVPRATNVDSNGKEIPHEFVSTEELPKYVEEMRMINKVAERKKRNKKGSFKIKQKIVIR